MGAANDVGSLLVDALFQQHRVNLLGMHRFVKHLVEVVLNARDIQGHIFLHQMLDHGGAVGLYEGAFERGPHGTLADVEAAGIQHFSLGLAFLDIVVHNGSVDQ